MSIPFVCPHCGHQTTVGPEHAGLSGNCAKCGNLITVPAGAAGAPGKPSYSPSVRSSTSNNTWIIVICVVLGCLGCGAPVALALLLPAVQMARESARRTQCSNQMRQIAIGMHNYHDVHKTFPAAFIADESGRPQTSWRVSVLPFVEAQDVYDQYDFTKPWDHPDNKRLESMMPDVYKCPSESDLPPFHTKYMVVVGEKTGWRGNRWTRLRDIRAGTSNVIMLVESSVATHWMEPVDLEFDKMNFTINRGGANLGSKHVMVVNVAMFDGSVQTVDESIDSETLKIMLLRDGQLGLEPR